MNPDTGNVYGINTKIDLHQAEEAGHVPFRIGEVVEIKGCYFKIRHISKWKFILKPIARPEQ